MANYNIRAKMNPVGISTAFNETMEKLEKFNSQHFICCEGNKTLIYTETTDENGNFVLKYLPEKDFLRMYNNCEVYGPNKKTN